MKTIIATTLGLFGVAFLLNSAEPAPAPAPAAATGVGISREEAQKIPSYDLTKIEDKGHLLAGKLVKIKFDHRSTSVDKGDDGKLHGSIGSSYSSQLRVIVPAEAEAWFMKIPTTYENAAAKYVIARLGSGNTAPAELLGREIKTDMKGSKIVW